MNPTTDPQSPPFHFRRVSGTRIVVLLFAFGIVSVAILWTYWEMHRAPFRPLQDALAREFENAAPRVDGGQRKMHQDTPPILRVVMRVSFDPVENQKRGKAVLGRVAEIAHVHGKLDDYEILELHLYQPRPEDEIRQQAYERKISELLSELTEKTPKN